MVVIVTLDTGDSYRIDRRWTADRVAAIVKADRGKGTLTAFQDDATPSRVFHIDPDHVVSIKDDGHAY